MKIAPILAFLLFATQVEAARTNTMAARIGSWLSPKHDARSIQEAFRKAARSGSYSKINKVIKLVSEHGFMIDDRAFEWGLQDVSGSGNLEAINLLVELADKRGHLYDYHNTFDFMIRNAAASGNLEAIDLVMKLADEHHLAISADSFSEAMARVAEKGDTETIEHIYTIVSNREVKLDADSFGNYVLREAANSGDPKTIALAGEIAAEHGIKLEEKHLGGAMPHAAAKDPEALEQLFKLINERGVKLEAKYFVAAMAQAAEHHSGYIYKKIELEIEVSDRTIELVVDFAAKQGVIFTADDFGLAMARAARYGNTMGVRKAYELAAEHGVIPNRKHFVASMRAAVKGGHHRTTEQTAKIADEYGIKFSGNDFVEVMLEAMDSLRYGAIFRINNLAIKHDVKLEKKHFGYLLAEAVMRVNPSVVLGDKEINTVIELATRSGIKIDAKYFSEAILYVSKRYKYRDARLKKLNELAIDHGVGLNAENF